MFGLTQKAVNFYWPICVCIDIYIYTHRHTHIYICGCMHTYVPVCMCVYVSMHICMYICMCMYVCMCVYGCMYVCIAGSDGAVSASLVYTNLTCCCQCYFYTQLSYKNTTHTEQNVFLEAPTARSYQLPTIGLIYNCPSPQTEVRVRFLEVAG